MAITQTFSEQTLSGTNLSNPTSLQFGPDGRLYVSQQNGIIKVYDVTNAGGTWEASNEEEITLVNEIPNHDDDGDLNTSINNRQVTGIAVEGTAENPILYVSSSDPRIGAGGGGADENLDTNSGIISRLTWNGTSWDKVDLVIGLPRSEENHSTNGLDIRTETVEVSPGVFEDRQIMYVMSGGHDNKGAPSNNFAWTPEYYYSAALLRVDLTQLEQIETDLLTNGGLNGGTVYVDEYVYALPTLDDPTRANETAVNGDGAVDSAAGTTGVGDLEAGDTFGGNDGRNQAKFDPDGPVQVYSPGYRNAYDVVITEGGNLYTFDNGPNNGWGGDPVSADGVTEVTSETQIATNQPNIDDSTNDSDPDNLHIIEDGTYGGHPNPTRASGAAAGLWSGQGGGLSEDVQLTPVGDPANDPNTVWDDLPEDWNTITGGNTSPSEGVYFGPDNSPGPKDESLFSINSSSNGITEYTAENIGDGGPGTEYLAVASFNGNITLMEIETDGTAAGSTLTDNVSINVGGTPLDVTALGNSGIPGTGGEGAGAMFVSQIGANGIVVLEPGDPPGVDLDADNDGVLDKNDPLQFDPDNGTATILNGGQTLLWDFNPASPQPGPDSEYNIGFSGWMIDGVGEVNPDVLIENPGADLLTDLNNTIRGGAPGVIQVKSVTEGDAYLTTNTQNDAIQTGFTPAENVQDFTIRVPIFNPYSSVGLDENFGSVGFALGDGTQFNYLKVVGGVGGGVPQLQVFYEEGDATTGTDIKVTGAQDSDFNAAATTATGNAIFELFLKVDVSTQGAATAQAFYNYELSPGGGMELAQPKAIGEPIPLQGEVLNAVLGQKTIQDESGGNLPSSAVVTLLSTSTGPEDPFEANFVDLEITSTEKEVPPTAGDDEARTGVDEALVLTAAELLANDEDLNGDDLTIESVGNNKNGTSVLAGDGSSVSFTPDAGFTGDASFDYTINDGNGNTATATVAITVADSEVLWRINAGTTNTLAAITDQQAPDEPGSFSDVPWLGVGVGAVTGDGFSVNTGDTSTHTITDRVDATDVTNDPTLEPYEVPAYVPQAIYTDEKWDLGANPEMLWQFGGVGGAPALVDGTYTVNLFMGNGFSGTSGAGQRVFDVNIEGGPLEVDGLDLSALLGHQVGGMFSYDVEVTDGTLDIEFIHDVENPLINGIEILGVPQPEPLPVIDILGSDQTVSEDGVTVDISIASDIQVPAGEQVDVTFEIASGTAVAGEDFAYTGGGTLAGGVYTHTLPIAGGSSDLTLAIDLLNDEIEESSEAFTVTITGVGSNATIGNPAQTITITDDDGTPPAPGEVVYRVNAGTATTVADADGGPDWVGDANLIGANSTGIQLSGNTGDTFTNVLTNEESEMNLGNLANPVPWELFINERSDNTVDASTLDYSFDVVEGTDYTVTIYYAENWQDIFTSPENRVFDVSVEGAVPAEFDDIHPLREAADAVDGVGSPLPSGTLTDTEKQPYLGTAFSKSATYTATDSQLNLSFLHNDPVSQNPKINAIEIVAQGTGTSSVVSVGAPSPASVEEAGDAGVTTLVFPVTFDVPPSAYTEVAYEVDLNGTVTPGTLALGVLDGEITVDVPNDDLANGDDNVTVALTSVTDGPATLGTTSASATVTEDDVTGGTVVAAINAGGPALTPGAINGIDFEADATNSYFTGGQTFTDGTGGGGENGEQPAFDNSIYETERYGADFSYAIPVDPGSYDVELHFAEMYQAGDGGPLGDGAGQRVFDVLVEGNLVLDDYDILSETGGEINQALVETIAGVDPTTDADDANINIQFVLDPGVDNSKVSGIVVRTAGEPAPAVDSFNGVAAPNDDWTGDNLNPDDVTLLEGANTLISTGELSDADYVTFTVANGQRVASIELSDYAGGTDATFLGLQVGDTMPTQSAIEGGTATLDGGTVYTGAQVNTDLLPLLTSNTVEGAGQATNGVSTPLEAGTYTLWFNQNQGLTESTLTITSEAVPSPGPGVYLPNSNGDIVFEVEDARDLPAGLNGWEFQTVHDDAASFDANHEPFTGDGFIEWDQAQFFNDPSNGQLKFAFTPGATGIYYVNLRSSMENDVATTEHNDAFTRITDVNGAPLTMLDGFKNGQVISPTFTGENGNFNDGWHKTYQSGPDFNDWKWSNKNVDNVGIPIGYQLTAGETYHLEIAARSNDYAIDRVHLAYIENPPAAGQVTNPVSPDENAQLSPQAAPGAEISGRVFADANDNAVDDVEPGIDGVTVTLLDDQGVAVDSSSTAADGSYAFKALADGTYSVQFPTEVNGAALVQADQGGDDTADSDADTAGNTPQVTVAAGDVVTDVDAGYDAEITLVGSAVLTINENGNGIEQSNFGNGSFSITNTGEKAISFIEIDVTDALLVDAVFDPFGLAGDATGKIFTLNGGSDGGTGLVTPAGGFGTGNNGETYIGAGGISGYEKIRLEFTDFTPNKTIEFGVDMDPNSIAGAEKGTLDSGAIVADKPGDDTWDVGGVGGAELSGGSFTVGYSDATTSEGKLQGQGDGQQMGAKALSTQEAGPLDVTLTVNGLVPGAEGTYQDGGPEVLIQGPAGETARVLVMKGFIVPFTNEFPDTSDPNEYHAQLDAQLAALEASGFPANNAVQMMYADVVLDGSLQDISNHPSFDFSQVAAFDLSVPDQVNEFGTLEENKLPLGIVASVIDPATDLSKGAVTSPIHLTFSEVPEADLSLTKTVSDATPTFGDTVTFDIEVSNDGPDAAGGITVADLMGDGYGFAGATASAGTFDNVSGVWTLGSLAAGATTTLTIDAQVLEASPTSDEVVYRVNPGGDSTFEVGAPDDIDASEPDWVFDNPQLPQQNSGFGSGQFAPGVTLTGGNEFGNENGAPVIDVSGLPVGSAAVADLFETERFGTQQWDFVVDNGEYTVNLYFAEIFVGVENNDGVGDRIFDVEVEGSLVLDDYDILADGGTSTAVLKSFDTTVGDGNLDIDFTTVNDNAKISAIEIIMKGDAGTLLDYSTSAEILTADVADSDSTPGNGLSGEDDDATLTLTPGTDGGNEAPVVLDDTANVQEDGSVSVDVLDNDSDPNSDPLAIDSFTDGTNGTVDQTAGGLTYTPNVDFNGSDSFTYTVSDGNGGFDTATVNVTINSVNDAPVAAPLSVSGDENTAISGVVTATDVDGDGLTFELGTGPSDGTVTVDTDGSFSYEPDADFNGTDSFTYTVADSNGGTATASVAVTVEDTGRVEGSTGDDTLNGTSKPDEIYGYAGNDVLRGMAGADILIGGAGADSIGGRRWHRHARLQHRHVRRHRWSLQRQGRGR